jgi:hypothetical protein
MDSTMSAGQEAMEAIIKTSQGLMRIKMKAGLEEMKASDGQP